MRVLALDTSTEACSAALYQDGRILGRASLKERGHAEQILQLVHDVLSEAGIGLKALDGIAAGVGPGAFTGVRVSVAVAQGLAFGAQLPVVPVTTLEALALRALEAGAARALACLDARMSEVYVGAFEADGEGMPLARSAPAVVVPTRVELPWSAGLAPPVAGIGRGFAAYPELAGRLGVAVDAGAELALPDARQMARLGALRLTLAGGIDAALLEPLYLRNKVAFTEEERQAGAK